MAIPTWGGVSYTATGRKIKAIIDKYPGAKGHLYITSSHRPHNPGSHHGGRLSYGGSPTAAVDVGFGYPSGNRTGGQGLANWLKRNFQADLVELIHNPSWYVKNGRSVGPYAVAIHYDHVHVAMSSAQADRILRRLGGSVPSAGSSGSSGGTNYGSVRNVKSQQKEVNLAGYKPKLTEDGKYGPKTKSGVQWYQRKIGVGADGIWGKATEAAHKKYKSGKTSKPSSTPKPTPSAGNLGPKGSVRSVGSQQKEVNLAGYTPKLVQDSKWGPKTEAGVKWYQRRIGVTADGIWGRNTDAAHAKYKAAQKKKPAAAPAGNRGPANPKLVEDGVLGVNTWKAVQKNLGVKADGIPGPVTIKALQKRVGAKQDGALGPVTVKALQKYLNAR